MSKNEESVGFTGIQFIMKVMIEYVECSGYTCNYVQYDDDTTILRNFMAISTDINRYTFIRRNRPDLYC